MENISFKVLNLILSNLDDKPSSIQPVQGYEDIYTVNFDNGEVAQVEVFPENDGINFHWVKVNNNQEILDKAYNDPKGSGEVIEFKGTKGKWISKFNGTYYDVDLENKNEQDRIVSISVMLYDENCKPLTRTDENKANALLISKAPEMLGMLNCCLGMAKAVNASMAAGEIERLIKSATQI